MYAEEMELNLGSLQFHGTQDYTYEGEFGQYLHSSTEGSYGFDVCDIDLGSLQSELGLGAIAWVRITSLDETTPVLNPGPDMDLFVLEGISTGVETVYEYSGPNTLYQDASSSSLATQLATVDFLIGDMDEDSSFVSIGAEGSLTMWFEYSENGGEPHEEEAGDQVSDGTGFGEDASDAVQDDAGAGADSVGGDAEPESENDDAGPLGPESANDPDYSELDPDVIDDGFEIQGYRVGLSDESMWLRLHEIAGISEWFMIDIGYAQGGSQDPGPNPVPGPAGLGILAAGATAIRSRRRR